MRFRSLIVAIMLPALLVLLIQHSPGVLLRINAVVGDRGPHLSGP